MASSQAQPTYSRDQVDKYFERLEIPHDHRIYDVSTLGVDAALKYLALLYKRNIAKIPFETLVLHYSPHRQVALHHEALFEKIIASNNGRGGYCMETNGLFGTLLRSLGFNIYFAGGRVNEGGVWTGWAHMVILVAIGDTKYFVDVGFGRDGPFVPMPLDGSGLLQPQVSPATVRLQWRNFPGNSDPNQRLWVYEYRKDDHSEWEARYCFTELEFTEADYGIMNYFTSTNVRGIFTRSVIVQKHLLNDKDEIVGSIILNGKSIKWRICGVIDKEIEFTSEQDRLNALNDFFGIQLGEVERDGIRGLPTEMK